MRPDLVVEGRAFVAGRLQDVEIGIDENTGRILAVKKTLTGETRRRFPGRILLPSGVDLHVHFRDPGGKDKEDFRTGTLGAALGGIGTVLDMPNTDPLVDRLSRLEEKRETVAPKACVDWGLWATLTPSSPDPLRLLDRANGLKLFLAATTGVERPGDDGQIAQWLTLAGKADRPTVLHAETAAGPAPTTLAQHDALRPAEGESAAVKRVARLAPTSTSIHVTHCSSPATAELAAANGFSAAATPHHLLLSLDHGPKDGFGKVNPPLRTSARRDELWAAFADGRIPILESDHAPHTLDEKRRPMPQAPAGVPGVETAYPLLLEQARTRRVPLARVVDALSDAPARRLGLSKGQLAPGYDADFFAVSMRDLRRIQGDRLASRCGWTPFEGWEVPTIETHFLRGACVVEDGAFVGRAGQGRPIPPRPASEAAAAWKNLVAHPRPSPRTKTAPRP